MSWQQPGLPAGTVMPQVEAHRTPHGLRMVRRASQGAASFAIQGTVGAIFLLVGLGIVLPAWAFGSATPVFMGFIALVAGVAVLAFLGTRVYRQATLEDANLDIPQLPLRLGDVVTVRFTQRRKGRSEIRSLTATLTCQEWVRYRQGTTTRTDTHRIWTQPLPAQPSDPVGDSTLLRGTWRVQIPPDLPPSFALPDNAVQWLLTVRADVANRPDIANTFTLPVLPEVVRDLR